MRCMLKHSNGMDLTIDIPYKMEVIYSMAFLDGRTTIALPVFYNDYIAAALISTPYVNTY